MKKTLLTFAAIAAMVSANAQTTYNFFDPADCDAEGWLWLDTQAKIDKYVGFATGNPATSPKIILESATIENENMEFDEPIADPELKGYNAEGVLGGEGSWIGGISLPSGSTSIGTSDPNGGGLMFYFPDLAQFDLKLSTEKDYILAGVIGGKGYSEIVDLSNIKIFIKMGIFGKPLASVSQYTWLNLQSYENADGLTLASTAGNPVTALIRNNCNEPLLVQAIRVFTYTDTNGNSAVEGIDAEENAPAVYYNLQGVQVKGNEPGIYICRQGSKTSKVVVK